MRIFIVAFLFLVGGCGGGLSARTACQNACVELGGGELQPGLTLDFGCGQVVITDVYRSGNNVIGYKTHSTAPHVFYLVDDGTDLVCTNGDDYAVSTTIAHLSVCVIAGEGDACVQVAN